MYSIVIDKRRIRSVYTVSKKVAHPTYMRGFLENVVLPQIAGALHTIAFPGGALLQNSVVYVLCSGVVILGQFI